MAPLDMKQTQYFNITNIHKGGKRGRGKGEAQSTENIALITILVHRSGKKKPIFSDRINDSGYSVPIFLVYSPFHLDEKTIRSACGEKLQTALLKYKGEGGKGNTLGKERLKKKKHNHLSGEI